MDLVLPFYVDAGLIALNDHLFVLLNSRDFDSDDGDLDLGHAVSILRFFVQLLELGINDPEIPGRAVQDLILANFPDLEEYLIGTYGVAAPRNSRFNYGRFVDNFRQLLVSQSL